MRTLPNYSNYNNNLRLTRLDAMACGYSGDCTADVIRVMKKPYVKKQLALINPENLVKELKEYGAWSYEDLLNHSDNLERFVWLSACDITENIIPPVF